MTRPGWPQTPLWNSSRISCFSLARNLKDAQLIQRSDLWINCTRSTVYSTRSTCTVRVQNSLLGCRSILRRQKKRYENPQLVAQHCFVASFRRCFPFFTLRDQLVGQQKCSLILWCRLREVVAKSRAQVYFGFVPRLSSNLQLVTQQIFSCCATNWGFLYLVFFAAFTLVWVAGR